MGRKVGYSRQVHRVWAWAPAPVQADRDGIQMELGGPIVVHVNWGPTCRHGLTYIRADSSAPWSTADNLGVDTQSPLCEPFPDIAEVLAAGQNLVSLDDRSSGIEEAGGARLQLHSIYHDL